ncbi:CU044_5270 family protein [Dactylosporangium sp. AC04546]|uniref:CU044_5270 family protein n=1 Tax=Dactylosporangium sp. AC04546 TaxID=2862460 RepID=UPI001EDDF6CE|nr:CU044_5270 family protein [Dactylosporangium sp. AC04546]WVK78249.1 CU044_5270 family protein [Dactylosporangium sp. AC04546]
MGLVQSLRDEIGHADPARELPEYVSHPATTATRWSRRRLVLVAAAGAVCVAAAVALLPGGAAAPAYAVTPPPLRTTGGGDAAAARAVLGEIAERVRQQAGGAPAGGVDYVRSRAWGLSFTASADVNWSAVVPYETRSWLAPDGSGRTDTTWLPPEQTWPDPLPKEYLAELPTGTTTERQGAGQHRPAVAGPPAGDPDGLGAQIYKTQPKENGPKSVLRGIADVCRDWYLPPAARVAALELLGGLPELVLAGETVDRGGRAGVAFAVERGNERDVIVVDRRTGAVLSQELVLTKDPGALGYLRYPAVVTYVLFLESSLVDAVPAD